MGGICMSISEKVQITYTNILEHFVRTGHAPHYTELAEMLDVGVDEARELQRESASTESMGCWMSHDTDYIESWAPFDQRGWKTRLVWAMSARITGGSLVIPGLRSSYSNSLP